ncbi:hypothetical protein [Nonomuraea jabiensis]|uniref:Uncharacterized protein n=1 Tax=Nonomuraea jabiensis TaxID=882448 RepID=A0A7W9FZF9_9ACTN|nr:hypothetical protein [Nonomuraea jabiensis]MBB5774366.1 hypothetical protein [Nonomuraea jabiensis]
MIADDLGSWAAELRFDDLGEVWNVDLAPTVTTLTNVLVLLPRPEREIP